MARGAKQIDGQISFDFCIDTENYVVQANSLIGGKQALKLNSAKLIRSAVMQVVREDEELKPYIITIKDLSELLNVPASNIYRDIEDITDDILKNPVYIREEYNGKTINFIKIPWVTRCEYKSDIGVALKLNDELKPFLVGLRKNYTQYTLQEVLSMKSIYGIRIFEMLQSKIMSKVIPKEGVKLKIPVQEIRECCDCEDKYPAFGNFRIKVIEAAVKEINRVTMLRVSYAYIKKSRNIVGIEFDVNMRYHP
ncbi:MAG: replication initiation protein [Lachnospiraceae bacterium]|nr:replication initiation protein [Lachnospiraceae bacterium]